MRLDGGLTVVLSIYWRREQQQQGRRREQREVAHAHVPARRIYSADIIAERIAGFQ
jgi:hypothetical protein